MEFFNHDEYRPWKQSAIQNVDLNMLNSNFSKALIKI